MLLHRALLLILLLLVVLHTHTAENTSESCLCSCFLILQSSSSSSTSPAGGGHDEPFSHLCVTSKYLKYSEHSLFLNFISQSYITRLMLSIFLPEKVSENILIYNSLIKTCNVNIGEHLGVSHHRRHTWSVLSGDKMNQVKLMTAVHRGAGVKFSFLQYIR